MRQYPKFMFLFIYGGVHNANTSKTQTVVLPIFRKILFSYDRLVVGSTGYDSVSWRRDPYYPMYQAFSARSTEDHKNPQRLLNGDEPLS